MQPLKPRWLTQGKLNVRKQPEPRNGSAGDDGGRGEGGKQKTVFLVLKLYKNSFAGHNAKHKNYGVFRAWKAPYVCITQPFIPVFR